jgi:hypothetical protein
MNPGACILDAFGQDLQALSDLTKVGGFPLSCRKRPKTVQLQAKQVGYLDELLIGNWQRSLQLMLISLSNLFFLRNSFII